MKNEEAIKHLEEWKEVITSSHRKEVIDMAIEALSADAVKVVLCKDCMYYSNGECKSGTLPFSEYSDLANVWLTPRPNDYCSYGERSEL